LHDLNEEFNHGFKSINPGQYAVKCSAIRLIFVVNPRRP